MRTAVYFCLCWALLLVGGACKKQADNGVTPTPPVVTTPATATTTPAVSNLVFYVSGTTGDDSRTIEQAKNAATPWKTIQKGVNDLPASATLIIAGGTYIEKVKIPALANGTPTAPTLIRNKPGETVILDGQNVGTSFESIVGLNGNQNLIVRGLKIQNSYWFGFGAEASTNISFDSCSTFNTRASGIYVKTTSQLTISRNNVRKACQEPGRDANGNGAQECITVAGVQNFTITQNEVWDSAVVGEGGEGIDAKGGSFNGEISGNYVHDLAELGIYVDAGSKESYTIRVLGNRLVSTSGLSVAGELGGHARDIYFYNNLVVNSKSSGLTFQSIGNGKFTNVYVVNNTFYNNAQNGFAGDVSNFSKNTGNGNLVIRNNIFYNKTANYRYSIWHDIAAPHVVGNNLYFDFKPSANGTNSFTATSLTSADIQADPQFVNAATSDFSLKLTSPALKKGVIVLVSGTPLFTTDFAGKSRGVSAWDMGAFAN
ncbi:MAG: right-handed parallel beta-helix repeat-containing protein [Spirosoma sp.]|nr:right-handed parallel beta-helix repeat-containing protein [Spirosoma sp.]